MWKRLRRGNTAQAWPLGILAGIAEQEVAAHEQAWPLRSLAELIAQEQVAAHEQAWPQGSLAEIVEQEV